MFVVDESKIVNGTYKGVMQVFSYDNANEIELPWSGQFLVLLRNQFGALPVVDYFEGNRYKLNEAIYHYRGSNVLEFIRVGGSRKTMVLVPLSVQVSAYNMKNNGIKGAYIPELEKEIQKVLEVIRNSGTNVTNKEKAFLNNLKFIEKELTDKTNVVFGKVEEVLNEVALVEQESERFLSLVRENERLVDEKVQDFNQEVDNTTTNINAKNTQVNTLASDFTADVAIKQSDVTSKYNAFDTSVTTANQTIDDILGLADDVQQVSAQVAEKVQNFKLKNEVVNGDFSNGLVGWIIENALGVVDVDGKLKVTSSGDQLTIRAIKNVAVTQGKYYVRVSGLENNSPSGNYKITFYDITHGAKGVATFGKDSSVVSTVIDVTGSLSATTRTQIIFESIPLNNTIYFKFTNLNIVNLTAIFGAGNEPTKLEMDELMKVIPNQWWDGELDLTQQQYVNLLLSFIREKANKAQEAWQTATLVNGYAGVVKYRINNFNNLEIIGSITSPTVIGFNAIKAFSLPMNYVPNWFTPNANYTDLRFKFSIATDVSEAGSARAALSGYNGSFFVTHGNNRNVFHLNISIPMRAV